MASTASEAPVPTLVPLQRWIIGFAQGSIFFAEYMMSLIAVEFFTMRLVQSSEYDYPTIMIDPTLSALVGGFKMVVLCAYFFARYRNKMEYQWLALYRLLFHPIALLLVGYHLLVFGLMIFFAEGHDVLFPPPLVTTKEGVISYYALFEYLIFSPFREEVIFRGLLYDILSRRLRSEPVLASPLTTSLIVNFLFALSHVINMAFTHFSGEYIALQIIVGFVIGVVFSELSYATRSLASSMLVHSFNNCLAIFEKTTEAVSRPMLPYVLTIVLYSVIAWYLNRVTQEEEQAFKAQSTVVASTSPPLKKEESKKTK
eukprot:TRINITY_DN203_c1_g6_i1.p1 TRINITY_DN203_c1_g6~~TRINITY_DN203_c1_g6_i1.p1  ORF type:complete len:323 (-),score=49.26 TRINITY_DN203_c1_g6_i1:125-1066(-)